MSGLMLRERLLTSNDRDSVRSVARTVTLTALRRLDRSRKSEVVRFLQEAGLIDKRRGSPVRLAGAILVGADLGNTNLTERQPEGRNPHRRLLDGRRPHAKLTSEH